MANGLQDITEIPGLNIAEALLMLDQNTDLLFKLLSKFPANHGRAAEQIRAAIAEGDFELAYRIGHSLKSVAGSIGAYELQDLSGLVAKAIREEQDTEQLLQSMNDAIQQVLQSIDTLVK